MCEVPGWGAQLPPARVLSDIRALGVGAVEAGPVGYLGTDAATMARLLAEHDLALVGGFVPVALLDERDRVETLADAERIARLYATAGGEVLVSALPADRSWSPRPPLDERAWRVITECLLRLDDVAATNGLRHVLHPHIGTLVETDADVARVLESSEVALCLDTGHLLLGGTDPAQLAREAAPRIAHVHLKDVRLSVAAELRVGMSLVDATRKGLFCPLGTGDAPIAETVLALVGNGYRGWYVLEQDTTLDEGALPDAGAGPFTDTRESIAFLNTLSADERTSGAKSRVVEQIGRE